MLRPRVKPLLAILVLVLGGPATSVCQTAFLHGAGDPAQAHESQVSRQHLAISSSRVSDPEKPAPAQDTPEDTPPDTNEDILIVAGFGLFVLVGIASWSERPANHRKGKRTRKGL